MYPVYTFESTESTNIIAREMAAKGEVHGAAVVAGMQTGGRGRLGKSWQSIAGKGLYCSIIVRPKIDIAQYAQITMVAGLAVAKAVGQYCNLKCMLKWPNDLIISGRKCAGILTESSSLTVDVGTRYAVIGIGLNVNSNPNDYPAELREAVTSLYVESGRSYDIEALFFEVRTQLLSELDRFCNGGFAEILKEWCEKDFLYGRRMECVGLDGSIISGIALGPDSQGQLHLRDETGKEYAVLSGDVRLAKRR